MPNVEYVVQENAKYPGSYLESLNIEWEKIKNNYRNPSEPITIPTPDYNKSEKLVINQEYVDMYNKEWLRRVGKNTPLNYNAPDIIPDQPQELDDMIQAENARLDAKEQSYQNMQFGKQRVLQLNQNFQERTSFFNWILFVLFLTFILTVICLYLGNTFPDYGFIFSGMMFIIILSGVGYAIYLYLSFLKRNPMNFDEIQYLKSPSEIKADNESKITAKTGEDLLNSSINTTYCTGPECCDTKDMTWDAENNKCVDNGPNYIYGTIPGTTYAGTTPSGTTSSGTTSYGTTPSGSILGNIVSSSVQGNVSISNTDVTDATENITTPPPTTTAKPNSRPRPNLREGDIYLDKKETNFVVNVIDKNRFVLSILHVASALYTSKDTVRFYLDSTNVQEVINKEYFIYFEKDENNEPIPISFYFKDYRGVVIVDGEQLTDFNPQKLINYNTPGIRLMRKNNRYDGYYLYQSPKKTPPTLLPGDEFTSVAGAVIKVISKNNIIFDPDRDGYQTEIAFTSMNGINFMSQHPNLKDGKVISFNSDYNNIHGQAIEIYQYNDVKKINTTIFTFNMNTSKTQGFTTMNPVENFENLPVIQINQYKIYPTLKNKSSQENITYQPKQSDTPFLEYKNFTNNLFSL